MTYIEQLYRLWYVDLRARRRFQVWTIVIGFAYGVFNSLALKRPEKEVTWETLGLICFLTLAFSVFYCARPQPRASTVTLADVFRNRTILALGVVSIIVIVGLPLADQIPTVKAAFLNLQLRKVVYSAQAFEPKIEDKTASLITQASADQVVLDPNLVKAAGNKYLEASKPNPRTWQTALTLLNYRSTLNSVTASPPPQDCLELPKDANGIIANVLNGTFDHCSQTLDHIAWKDIVFKNSIIMYHGGPTVFENVTFVNCQFILDFTPSSKELGRNLLASNAVTLQLPGG